MNLMLSGPRGFFNGNVELELQSELAEYFFFMDTPRAIRHVLSSALHV